MVLDVSLADYQTVKNRWGACVDARCITIHAPEQRRFSAAARCPPENEIDVFVDVDCRSRLEGRTRRPCWTRGPGQRISKTAGGICLPRVLDRSWRIAPSDIR